MSLLSILLGYGFRKNILELYGVLSDEDVRNFVLEKNNNIGVGKLVIDFEFFQRELVFIKRP